MGDPTRSLAARVAAFVRGPAARRVAFGLAVVVGIATFAIQFYADDWAILGVLEHRIKSPAGPFDLYRFATGDAASGREMIARGPWPWWMSPTIRLYLFRPLSSALFTMDHALFGRAWIGYHLDALVCWLVTVLAAAAVLRRAVPPAAAALALLLFVVDDAHVQPIGWIACRHVLVAATPALFAVAAHLRFREAGWRMGQWLAPALLAVGLLGGETALGGAALLFAYEIVGPPASAGARREPFQRRLVALAPSAAIAAAYLAMYRALGCGASESGAYVEPLREPASFAVAVAQRLPILLGDLLASIPADFSNVAPRTPFVLAGALAVVGVAALGRHVWSSLDGRERAAVRWLSLGAVLGAGIGLAGFPGGRVLLVPSVAAFGVLALLIERSVLGPESVRMSRGARVGGSALLAIHGVIAPMLLVIEIAAITRMARGTERIEATMLRLDPPLPKRLYVVAASDPMGPFYASAIRAMRRPGDIHTVEIFSMAKRTHRVTRTGPGALRLETLGGTFFDGGFVEVFRARRLGLHAGEAIALEGARVLVLADQGGAPTAIEIALDAPLDDPSIALLAWDASELRPLALAVGESRDIPWSPGPSGLF